ncbi:MAG: MFS transporter [Alphaproteobacteria bacterium]|nr:MFS transporter [Alphaproteobacteria bacterium]
MDTPATFSLRPPVPLEPGDQRTLLLVSLAFFVAGYDLTILGFVLKPVLSEFGAPTEDAGLTIAFVRIGVILALILSALSDRFGRRALLLFTVCGSAVTTLLTAFAPNLETFIVAQGLVRAFGYAQDMVSIVVVAEEMNERVRGWALGVLTAMGAAGAGAAAVVYAAVDIIPFGWRGLYIIGAVPLVFLAFLWTNLQETKRYVTAAAKRTAEARRPTHMLAPLIAIATKDTARFITLILVVLPFAFGGTAALVLHQTFLQEERAFSPGLTSLFVIGSGAFALIGNFIAGRLSDLIGRRTVFCLAAILFSLSWALFYLVPSPIVIGLALIIGLTCYFALDVTSAAFGAELFPTEYRSTGSAVRMAVMIIAGGIALILQSLLIYGWFGSHAGSNAALLIFVPLSAVVAWWFLPETAGRSLEDISRTADD